MIYLRIYPELVSLEEMNLLNTTHTDETMSSKKATAKTNVYHLGQEHEDESLAEVAVDADHGECHAGEVAVRVSHESACRVPGREQRERERDTRGGDLQE